MFGPSLVCQTVGRTGSRKKHLSLHHSLPILLDDASDEPCKMPISDHPIPAILGTITISLFGILIHEPVAYVCMFILIRLSVSLSREIIYKERVPYPSVCMYSRKHIIISAQLLPGIIIIYNP